MPNTPTGDAPGSTAPAAAPHEPAVLTTTRGPAISEDWLATVAGLVLLGLVLAGAITKAMIP